MLEGKIVDGKKIVISKKTNLKGEDGHKIFSIRLKDETANQLDNIAKITNRSRNELINIFLDFAILNYEVKD